MIKSMTGYGRFELEKGAHRFTIELKGVNHRYLDINIRMPKTLNYFETAIRSGLKKKLSRGKVDIFITYEDLSENRISLKYNRVLAEEYLKYLTQMKEDFGIENDVKVTHLSRYPEVLTMEDQGVDQEELWNTFQEALQGAVDKFIETKILEGDSLKNDLIEKLDNIGGLLQSIEERSPEIINQYRSKLELKVKELLADYQLDDSRILTEVTLFADKICTDEEAVRLKSHISHMKETLSEKDGVGRKLDFIAQEMNREANTILSKANDLDVSNCAIGLKSEIEKIREQIQNVE